MNEWLFTDPKCHAPLYVVGHCLPDRLCAVGCRPCVLAVPWFRHDSWRLLEPWNLHAKHLPRCSGQPRYLQVCRWLLGRGLPVHQPGFSGLPDRDPRHHALAVAGLRCTFFTIESNTTLLMVQSSHPHTLAECLPSRTLLLAFRSPRRALLVLRAVRTSSLLPMARYVAPFVSPTLARHWQVNSTDTSCATPASLLRILDRHWSSVPWCCDAHRLCGFGPLQR